MPSSGPGLNEASWPPARRPIWCCSMPIPLENIANSRRIAGVMLRGPWLSRADLDRILSELRS